MFNASYSCVAKMRMVVLLGGGLFLLPDATFLHVTPWTLSYETFQEEQVAHLSHSLATSFTFSTKDAVFSNI